jgi:integrase
MPKRATPLTVRQVQAQKNLGMFADGGGLYLHVGPGGKSWVYRYQLDGRRRDMGLGPLDLVSLAQARDRVLDLRREVRNGVDPIEQKRQAKVVRLAARGEMTFSQATTEYIDAHEAAWSDKRAWPDTMRLHVNPVIGDLPVAAVDLAAVMRVLEPIWQTKTKTAQNIRGRIEAVLDWAAVRNLRKGENPARWRGNLDSLLARPSRLAQVEHHKALPYSEIPAFMAELRTRDGMAPAALDFVVLTCARAGEVLGATWDEIDLGSRVWTVPAARMKGSREHRSPLSSGALAVLDRMAAFKSNSQAHVFLGQRSGRPMTPPALLQCLAYVRPGITVHGFRSSFRDWAAEQTDFPTEAAELALAHTVGSKVERAYRRSDLFSRRRELAERWSAYCGSA